MFVVGYHFQQSVKYVKLLLLLDENSDSKQSKCEKVKSMADFYLFIAKGFSADLVIILTH